MEKYNISRSGYLPKFQEMLRLPRKVTLHLHQILPLPRKMNLMIDPHQIWNVIYNARSNQSHPPTAANTAPATQSHSHDSSSSHMKRHLQCAEQHWFPSNITKYCACHEILSSRCQRKIPELLPPIERRFEDNPTMIRAWNRHLAPAASETLLFASCRRTLYGKIQHFALRLSIKISRSAALATKNYTPTSPSAAPATKSDTPTSPNTAPATKNAPYSSQRISSRHLYCLRIYSLRLCSPGIYSLRLYSPRIYSLRIYSLSASIVSWHLLSLGIYSLLASILSRHLFSLGIYSL